MQHNFLTNYCLFYLTLDSSECFKVLSSLSNMNIVKMPQKHLELSIYQAKKEVKSVRQKDKNVKNEFEMIVIKEQDVNFIFNRQKNNILGSKGHMTIASKHSFDMMLRNKLLGEVSLEKSVRIMVQNLMWQNFIVSHYEIAKDKSLLIIQQMFSSTLFKQNNSEQYQTHKKTKAIFEPILDFLFTPQRTNVELLKFQKELSNLRLLYPQINKEVDKMVIQINYCLIYYYAICQAIKQKQL